ncbi:hypothetical protein ACAW74_12155 [Fibrella sp. WM1]|uniref:hypothetical protein n=1 Tax=Fibrella musci TaxID=3242485 RepID=UPI0035211870
MKVSIKSIRHYLLFHPAHLFLLDGVGALITGGTLFCVARWYPTALGLPPNLLAILGRVAFVYAVYSMTCYLVRPRNTRLFLRFIAVANLVYCLLMLLAVIYHFQRMTIPGLVYFFVEDVVVVCLVYVELTISPMQKN